MTRSDKSACVVSIVHTDYLRFLFLPPFRILLAGDLTLIGRCMNDYWEQKKRMAPGCEPTAVSEMMTLLRPHVLGLSMAGAGGGGFLYVLTKQPHARAHVEQLLHAFVVR